MHIFADKNELSAENRQKKEKTFGKYIIIL
jgi:hypothetical protein